MESKTTFKAAIIGSTGAAGKELIRILNRIDSCEQITVLARRRLEEWDDEEYTQKLVVVECDNMDNMEELKDKFEGHDAFYCCLGSAMGKGKDLFVKVDYQYPLDFANMAKSLGAQLYCIVTSELAKSTSWSFYLKTKGKVEDELKKIGFDKLIIMQPGLLVDRDGESRVIEKIFKYVPFYPKVKCTDVSKVMVGATLELIEESGKQDPLVIGNCEINKRAKKLDF